MIDDDLIREAQERIEQREALQKLMDRFSTENRLTTSEFLEAVRPYAKYFDWYPDDVTGCYDCGTPYPWPLDSRIDNDLWARIAPENEGNILLCANCIVERMAQLDPSPIVVKMTPVWVEEYDNERN